MDLILLLYSLLLAGRSFCSNASNSSSNFSILFVQEFSPSRFSEANLKYLLTFIQKLWQAVDRNGQTGLLFGIGGDGFLSYPDIDTISKTNYSDLLSIWNVWDGISLLGSSMEVRNVALYANMFDSAQKCFNNYLESGNGSEKIITQSHEQCKANECLKNDCCIHCDRCNASSCDKLYLNIANETLTAKLFVSDEAEILKKEGAAIIVVGVGSKTEPARLKCFASKERYVHIDDYDELPTQGFDQILRFVTGATTTSALLDSTTTRTKVAAILPWGFVVACLGLAVMTVLFFIVLAILIMRRRKQVHGTRVPHGHHAYNIAATTVTGERHTTAKLSGPINRIPTRYVAHKHHQEPTPHVESISRNGKSNFRKTMDSTAKAKIIAESVPKPLEDKVRKSKQQAMLVKAREPTKEYCKKPPAQTGEHPLLPPMKRNVRFASKMVDMWSYTDSGTTTK